MRVSRDKLPGDALALSLQKVWEVIRDQKDLNLPAHKVRVASSAHKRSHGLALQREFCLRNVEPSDLMERSKCGASWLEMTPGVVFQVMVANIRCTEIMEEQLRSLAEDQAWASLRQESEAGSVPNFGSRAGGPPGLMHHRCGSCLSQQWSTCLGILLASFCVAPPYYFRKLHEKHKSACA